MAELKGITIIKPHKVGIYTFDTTIFEQHASTTRKTANPIEYGADTTDHAFVEPLRLTINAIVADVPLRDNPSFNASTTVARSSSAYQTLLTYKNNRELITVQTGLANYPNMLIISLEALQDKNSPDILNFLMTLEELFIVTVRNVGVPTVFLKPGTTQALASTTTGAGQKLTVNPTPVQVTTLQKWIAKGYPNSGL